MLYIKEAVFVYLAICPCYFMCLYLFEYAVACFLQLQLYDCINYTLAIA